MPVFEQRLPTPEVQPADLPSKLPTIFEFAEWIWDRIIDWIARIYEAVLTAYLIRELGERGASENCFTEHGCPDCGSVAARRKGRRERTIAIPQLGDLTFERPYVQCRDCGRSYAPFDRDIGLEPRSKYLGPALVRPLAAVCEVSYRRGAEAYPESPSAMTLWRRVMDHQPSLPRGPQQAEEVCVVDATGIPGREADQQHALGIAHQVRPGGFLYNRPVLERRPIGAICGEEHDLRGLLLRQDIDWVIHDGAMDLEPFVEHPVRCRWHIGHAVGKGMLYRDGITGEKNKQITKELIDLLHDPGEEADELASQLRSWADRHREKAPKSARHVEKAIEGLTEPIKAEKDLPVRTTSPAEREIRELNRRFENGGQWTKEGARRLLTHVQMYRHRRTEYTHWIRTITDLGKPKAVLASQY